MFEAEARWIAKCLEHASNNLEDNANSVLNLGSSTRHYREIAQPYINKLIFEPMKERFSFTHADAKQGDGIDLSGDFCEPAFWEQINDRSYDVIICSNLLTHVFDRDIIINNIKRLAKEKSYIVVTSPFIYPYCADPYDSKFRPDCQQLLGLFPELELLDAATVSSGTGHVYRLLRNKRDLASFLINVILPRKGMKRWRNVASDVPNIFMHFQTSCVFLQSVSRTKAVSDFAAGR